MRWVEFSNSELRLSFLVVIFGPMLVPCLPKSLGQNATVETRGLDQVKGLKWLKKRYILAKKIGLNESFLGKQACSMESVCKKSQTTLSSPASNNKFFRDEKGV